MWREIGTLDDRDDAGGDQQVGRAYGRRFARQLGDGVVAAVEIHYYAARDVECAAGARPNEIWVGRETTYTLCTDPTRIGDTETWSDTYYHYRDRDRHIFRTVREAERRAERLAKAFRPSDITWNGRRIAGWSDAPHPKDAR